MKLFIELKWQAYRYFPYEKRLALREVKTLLGVKPKSMKTGLRARLSKTSSNLLERLTYFREIRLDGTANLIPLQTRLEASAFSKDIRHRKVTSIREGAPVLTRQSTRYSAHGLHDYKGKFNPQIVRAIGNLLKLAEDAWVLDPFCGSGTSLLECAHFGWNALGIDLNPLAVFISNTKLEAMKVNPDVLQEQVRGLVEQLLRRVRDLDLNKPLTPLAFQHLRPIVDVELPNRAYLEKWFPPSVLAQLECIEGEIRSLESAAVQNIARVVLSDGLRAVSWQDPRDLRIRRRKDARQNYPAIPSFVTALTQRTDTIIRARAVLGKTRGVQRAVLGDSRNGLSRNIPIPRLAGEACLFDCVITSPPYATALPYVDTQRLSLAFLGLLRQDEIGRSERLLIGNREITLRERESEEENLDEPCDLLPREVLGFCRRIQRLAARSDGGFRRRNVPSLLFRYFRDMRCVFSSIFRFVRPGGHFALVVGPNRTTLGEKEIRIDSPHLLTLVAQHVGWRPREIIPLNAYPRFDLHRKNSITAEALVILSRPVRGQIQKRP